MTGDDFPSFLYPDGQYDPNDMENGLMRGLLVVRIWRHLFTSPSLAVIALGKQRSAGTKGCQATMNGLTTPTPATIAYAVLQTYWFLCPLDDWRLDDGVFDKQEFFRNILNIFAVGQWGDVENEGWAVETLRWWEEQVLPLKALTRAAYEATIPSDLMSLVATAGEDPSSKSALDTLAFTQPSFCYLTKPGRCPRTVPSCPSPRTSPSRSCLCTSSLRL